MKDLIKTVALVVAKDVDIGANNESTAALVEWVLIHGLAELSKRAEAVAYDVRDSNGDGQTVLAKYVKDPNRLIAVTITKLFTFPPIRDIEAIENSVAEACASLAYETLDDTFLSGHGYATNISEAIRSGEWRKYK